MTVKEVFDLRKQGRIEEAYDTIRPMYAAHKGRYTTLCMFWTAADVFKLRLEQGRVEEGEKILEALKRMLPRVEAITNELDTQNATSKKEETKYPWEHDKPQQEGSSAATFITSATHRLEKAQNQESKKEEMPSVKDSFNSNDSCSKKEELTDNSRPITRQLTSEEKSPQGDNICDIRDICETKEEANISEPQEELSLNSVSPSPQEDEISNSQILDRKDPRLTDLNAPPAHRLRLPRRPPRLLRPTDIGIYRHPRQERRTPRRRPHRPRPHRAPWQQENRWLLCPLNAYLKKSTINLQLTLNENNSNDQHRNHRMRLRGWSVEGLVGTQQFGVQALHQRPTEGI